MHSAEILYELHRAQIPVSSCWVPYEAAWHWLVIAAQADWHERLGIESTEFARRIANVVFAGKDGLGVQQDYAKAMIWYQNAEAQGDDAAENNIGLMYYNGLGVPQDYAQAIGWFERAAAKGNDSSERNLGVIYLHGMVMACSRITQK